MDIGKIHKCIWVRGFWLACELAPVVRWHNPPPLKLAQMWLQGHLRSEGIDGGYGYPPWLLEDGLIRWLAVGS